MSELGRKGSVAAASSEIKVGSRVRPVGSHIARTHIGTVTEIIAARACRCCGQPVPTAAEVEWDLRRGEGAFTWSLHKLELVGE